MKGTAAGVQIEPWWPDGPGAASLESEIDLLGQVLHAVVHDGAGVSFIVPFALDEARAFWLNQVLPSVRAGTRHVLVARRDDRIVGTVQLDLAMPPNQRHRAEVAKLLVHPTARRCGVARALMIANQRHRAEVAKLLVHPTARRCGVARALMIAIEAIAQSQGRTLLTLDTWTGGPAEALYRSLGYVAAGVIPRYARGSTTADLAPTTIMYKELVAAERRP